MLTVPIIHYENLATQWRSEKLVIKERELPVTIIAVVWEGDDSILIAADSGETEMPDGTRAKYLHKLKKHPTAPLAWGMAGDMNIGVNFSEWLQEYEWPPKNLTIFREELATELADLNGKERERIKRAGFKAKKDDFCDALVAGYLDTPFAFGISYRGKIGLIEKEHGFDAIGSGSAHAKITYRAYTLPEGVSNAMPNILYKMRLTMEVASVQVQNCDLPVHIWRITKDKIERIVDSTKLLS
jgi:hypothetical protein